MKHSTVSTKDIERDAIDESYLTNTNVHSFAWRNIKVESRKRKSDSHLKCILSDIDGYAQAGTIL